MILYFNSGETMQRPPQKTQMQKFKQRKVKKRVSAPRKSKNVKKGLINSDIMLFKRKTGSTKTNKQMFNKTAIIKAMSLKPEKPMSPK